MTCETIYIGPTLGFALSAGGVVYLLAVLARPCR